MLEVEGDVVIGWGVAWDVGWLPLLVGVGSL